MILEVRPIKLDLTAPDIDREIKSAILGNMGRIAAAVNELIRRQNEAIGGQFSEYDPNAVDDKPSHDDAPDIPTDPPYLNVAPPRLPDHNECIPGYTRPDDDVDQADGDGEGEMA